MSTKPKMKDVATLAGVSIKTVSRVLNNEPHVQESVRTRVRDAVEKLGYVPSRSARSLRSTRSFTISMICQRHNSSYVNSVQFGALLACQSLGYQLNISLPDPLEGKSVEEIIAMFERMSINQEPDGVLLVAPYASDPRIAEALKDLGIATTRIGPVDIETDGVVVQIDDRKAARELTEHLLELGHKRIAYVRGREEQRSTQERFLGYQDALADAGIEVDPTLVLPGKFDFESGLEAAEMLLQLPERPSAVFAANDDMAAGVVLAAQREGIAVPADLSVVGFDDSDIAVRMSPRLTTVKQSFEELGRRAITTLVHSFGSNGTHSEDAIILPHEFIARGSTSRVPD